MALSDSDVVPAENDDWPLWSLAAVDWIVKVSIEDDDDGQGLVYDPALDDDRECSWLRRRAHWQL